MRTQGRAFESGWRSNCFSSFSNEPDLPQAAAESPELKAWDLSKGGGAGRGAPVEDLLDQNLILV